MSENLKRCPECKNVLNSSNIKYSGTEPFCRICGAPLRSYLNMIEQSDLNAISKLETEYLDSILNKGDKNVMNLESDYNRIGLPFEEQKKRVIHFLNKLINSYKPVLVNGEVENFDNVDSIVSQLCKNFSIDKVSYLKKLYRIKNKCLKKHNKKVALILIPSCIGVILISFIIFVMSLEFLVFNGTVIKYQKNAEDVVIPETYYGQTITKIGNDAFNNKKVRSVKMPNTVTEIGRRAFYNCAYLENINISTSLETINSEAFSGCVSLDEVIISENIESLGEKVFDRCDDLNIVVNAKTPPKFSRNTFEGIDNFTINVPENSVELYKDSLSSYKENIKTSLLKIKFIVDNEIYHTEKLEYGNNLKNLPEVPTKAGYIGSWEVNEVINITSDQIVNIIWKPLDNIQYKVVHKLQNVDGSYTEDLVETLYGTTDDVIKPTAKQYTGYNLYSIDENAIKGDGSLVLEIKYNRNAYKINFETDGGNIIESINVVFGHNIPTLPIPVKIGYIFDGWNIGDIDTMPIDDLTLKALWKPRNDTKYLIKYYLENLDGTFNEIKSNEKIGITEDVAVVDILEFSGFNAPSEIPSVSIKGDGSTCVELYYTRNSYSVTYLVDDEIYAVKFHKYEEKFNDFISPTKTGYNFTGFNGLIDTMPATNITVYATFEICRYKIYYKVDGNDYYTIEYDFGDEILDICNPSKKGYNFEGWYLSEEFVLKFSHDKMPSNDLIVYAKWNPRSDTKYLVNYHQEQLDGTFKIIESIEKEGVTDSKVVVEEKKYEGFTFLNEIFDENINSDGTTIVNVKYQRNTYVIKYMVGNNVYLQEEYKYGEKIKLINETLTVGYDFVGWYLDAACENSFIEQTMKANDIILYGKEVPSNKTIYHVLHQLEQIDGTFITEVDEILQGTTAQEATYSIRKFDGYISPTISSSATLIAGDGSTIIVLKYLKEVRTLTYMINDEIYIIQYYKVGENVIKPSDPIVKGYDFEGWLNETPQEMPNYDIIIYAKTTICQYLLSIYLYESGELISQIYYKYNESIPVISVPIRPGYEFIGWNKDVPETMPNEEVLLYGNWNPIEVEYQIQCFHEQLDGSYQLFETIVKKGISDSVPMIDDKNYEGFTKVQNSINDVINGDGSTKIKIYYKRNTYTISYMLDNAVYQIISYKYGEIINAIVPPMKEGYIFVNWNESIPSLMPANNIKVNPIWEIITYTINYDANGGKGTTNSSTHTYFKEDNLSSNGFNRHGWVFLGWSTNPKSTIPTYINEESVINISTGEEVTLYAIWEIIDTLTMTCEVNSIGNSSMYNDNIAKLKYIDLNSKLNIVDLKQAGYKSAEISIHFTLAARSGNSLFAKYAVRLGTSYSSGAALVNQIDIISLRAYELNDGASKNVNVSIDQTIETLIENSFIGFYFESEGKNSFDLANNMFDVKNFSVTITFK